MWDKRESNMMHRDQNMNFDSVGTEIPFVQRRFPHPNNSLNGQYFAEASGKRKSMDMDPGHDAVSPRFLGRMGDKMGNPLQRDYTLQHNAALPPQVDSLMPFYNNSGHANPSNAETPYGAFQFYKKDSILTLETKDENIGKASFGSLPPFHQKGTSFPVQTPREIAEHHDSKNLARDIVNQYEPSKFPSQYGQNNGLTEISQDGFGSNDGKTLVHENNGIPCNPCSYSFSMPSNNMTALGSSNLRVVDEIFHSDVWSFGQKFSKNRLFEEKEFGQMTRLQEGRDISIGKTRSTQTSAFNEGEETYGCYQYLGTEIRSGSSVNNDKVGASSNPRQQSSPPTSPMPMHSESSVKEGCLGHVTRGFDTSFFERAEGSNTENTNHTSEEETSPSDNTLADPSVEPNDKLPLNLEEHTQSIAGKVSLLIAEKLWDGSLQLSTSTTVSAVAFFKSGEKAQGTKWSKHVEIKGKVRLQAFEKFIQELPRSRNRALMVISLCWKPGSPEAGLAGMKEVAKGYKESQRVGFAQICPGFDLYVCPRSDTIITILAKYGFFKGMAAVEDDQDSLIGCVIWRRGGQISSISIPKISEKKKTTLPDQHPSNSPEPSVPEINSPVTQVDDSDSKQEKAPTPLISTFDSTKAMMAERKAIQSTNNFSHGSDGFHINGVSEVSSLMPYNSPLIQVQPPAAQKLASTCLQQSIEHIEVPISQAAEPKKHDGGTQLVQPILPASSQMLQGDKQQTNTQFSNGSHNFNYNSCPPPALGTLVSLDSPFIRSQLPSENLDSSYRLNPMQSNSKPELTLPALPGPPPLPPDILQRIIEFSRGAHKAPTEGMPKADPSFMPTGEPKKPRASSRAEKKSSDLDDDDDGDLPEFDFDSECGVPKAPVSRFPGSSHQTYFQFPHDQQTLVSGIKNENGPMHPPAVKSMGIRQSPCPSGFPGRTLDTYQGPSTTLPTRFEELNSEKKPAEAWSLSQQFPAKADKYSSSSRTFSQTSRWDDDDDMPEWCPPDLEHLDTPKPGARVLPLVPSPVSENAKELPSIPPMAAFYPPLQSHSFAQGYHAGMQVPFPASPAPVHIRPAQTANPAPVHNRPAAGFASSDFRPPQAPNSNHPMRPPPPSFGAKPPISDVSRQWKRH